MNLSAFWLAGLGPWQFTMALLLVKLTVVLAAAWILHAACARANPRWQRLVWRITAVGALVLAVAAALPPLHSWAVLPAGSLPPTTATPTDQLAKEYVARPPGGFSFSPDAAPRHFARASAPPERQPPRARISIAPRPPADQPLRVDRKAAAARSNWRASVLWLATIWCLGVALLLMRTLLGIYRLTRIRRRASAAPAAIALAAAEISRRLGCRRTPVVLLSCEVATPSLMGVRRPAILLPESQCDEAYRHELPAILAHEIAHVRGGDCAWNLLVHAVSMLCWFHPLAWRMRVAHAAACDAVCDAIAADYLGDAAEYGRTLARLALRVMAPRMIAGMTMAHSSNVRHRIEALRRRVYATNLRRCPVVVTVALGLAAFPLLGTLAITPAQADQEQTKSAAPNDARTLTSTKRSQPTTVVIHVLDEAGQPLADAEIRFNGRVNGSRFDRRLTTDASGNADLEVPTPPQLQSLWMTCAMPGRVPVHHIWDGRNTAIELPEELDIQLVPGTTIGGRVEDNEGQPVEAAKIEITMPVTWPNLANYVFTAFTAKTDAEGRWTWTGAPPDLGECSLHVEHTDFLKGSGGPLGGPQHRTVLKRGLSIYGRVTDAAGRAIETATVRAGFDRFGTDEPVTTTDRDGRFTLKNCQAGKSLLTVQADTFAPQFQEVTIGERNPEVSFKLAPGHTMRVRIVDVAGNGVPGATFCTDTWRGFRSLELRVTTDAEGRVEWHSAPNDQILCDIFKRGYMSTRRVSLTAGDEEHIVTLHPELVISGKVTDAATGKPLAEFRVRQGQIPIGGNELYWGHDDGTPFTGGTYRYKFDEPLTNDHFLRVEAPGYKPGLSRSFKWNEGAQTFDFQVTRADGPSGLVLLPDGGPAAGAEVAVATRQTSVSLSGGYLERRGGAERSTTDAEGRFTLLPREGEPFLLIVVHDAGYAEVSGENFAKSNRVALRPWGRIEGRVMIGRQGDANREVSFWPDTGNRSTWGYIFNYGYTTTTDAEGRFAFQRAIAGPGQVSRVVVTPFGEGRSQHSPGWQTPVDVPPGGTVSVMIGGTGRPVTALVKQDRQADIALDWTTNEPATIKRKRAAENEYFRAAGNIDKTGRFRIPDVPAGEYELRIPLNNPSTPNACGAGTAIGRCVFDFVVPPMTDNRSDEPLDLGTVTATLFDTLDVGETAPDFVLEGLGGGTVRLRELHGKLVLVNFWATWCRPCLAEMPALGEIHRGFSGNPRFAMLGLACDQSAEPARKYVAAHGLGWTHAHAGASGAGIGGVAEKYTVRELPATFLIAPDGRVLAKNLRGEKLKLAIAAALADEALFAAATMPPARFPVTRFKQDPRPPRPEEDVAVLVMDDSDPDFDKDKPHHDTLTAYSDRGTALWTVGGFNTCQSVSAGNAVAVDAARERIYVTEKVGDRVVAIDFGGRKHWQAEQVGAGAIALDARTGNLWLVCGSSLNQGETVVLDPEGEEVAAYPTIGIDIVNDPKRDLFWLAGYEILQLDRKGQPRVRLPVNDEGGWCCASAAVDPTDGSAWFGERQHPDVENSHNRLLHVDAQGQVIAKIDLDKFTPFKVARSPADGELWIIGYPREIRRMSPDGKFLEPLAIGANNVAFNTAGDVAWVTTEKELLKLDATGHVIWRHAFEKPSRQIWLTAY